MMVKKNLQVQLNEEDMQVLAEGNPLQIPVDQDTGIVIYPPANDNGGGL